MANFATALISMQRGHKVRRHHWAGYWEMKDNEVIIHTREGRVLNLRDTEDMTYTLSNISCDDWEVAKD